MIRSGIDPFDQPDVELAKKLTKTSMLEGQEAGTAKK